MNTLPFPSEPMRVAQNTPLPGPLPKLEPATVLMDVRGLSFFYGDKKTVDGISLPLQKNRITAIIGPSGCGKSTFLRCLNRIFDLYPEQRAEGEVLFAGKNILGKDVDTAWLRKRVGMVFQKPTPFPMSVFDNVAYGIRLYEKLKPNILAERVEKALRRAALWDEVKDQLKTSGLSLSGGQQQRLCIARALAVDPEILLLDEPTSALDPLSSAHIEALLNEIKDSYTIVMVTHNLQQAARIADEVAFLYMGKLIEHGPSWKMFDAPSNPKTQEYISGLFG